MSNIVYVVEAGWDYEGTDIKLITFDYKQALAYQGKLCTEKEKYDVVRINEVILDKEYD